MPLQLSLALRVDGGKSGLEIPELAYPCIGCHFDGYMTTGTLRPHHELQLPLGDVMVFFAAPIAPA